MVTRRKRLTDYERAVNAFVERYNVPLDGMRATHCVWIAGWLAGWKERSRTLQGIADAMAEQWGCLDRSALNVPALESDK